MSARLGELMQLDERLGLAASTDGLLLALVAQAPVGVFVTDRLGSCVYSNARVCELTGLPAEQLLGAGWAAALHPEDAERVTEAWTRASRAGDTFELEYRFLRPDGSVVWVSVTASALRGEDAVLVGWAGVTVDLTARKLSEERYSELFEHASDAVFTADASGNLTAVNHAAERITGFDRVELLGKSVFELVVPEEVERARQALAGRLLGEPSEVVELPLATKDGRPMVVEVSGRLVLENGEPARIEAIARDITEWRSLQQQLAHQAFHDDLTGLPNRHLFLDRLEQALTRSERDGRGLAVMVLDLDHFKLVNDSFGHATGDELLRSLAAALQRALRASDTVARFGGDEFAFLIEGIKGEQPIVAIAEGILAVLAEPLPVEPCAQRATGTLGIAIARAGDSAEDLLRSADTAMYRAKERKRGGYEIYDTAMRARAVRRANVQSALAEALAGSELSLHYQPVVALDDERVLGLEALLRWEHPQWGWVQPSEFIPLAEETHLSVPLAQRVIAEAARQAAAWRRRYPDALPWGVAINLSPRELSEKQFLSRFERELGRHGARPADLAIEVTERTFLDPGHDTLADNLLGLHQLGVRLSLDDFGTGYSALASLQRFPFSVVKIDRVFTRRITGSSPEAPIAEAIITLAHTLGMQVIAEGVETPAQARYLRRVGCDAAQGFHFARPQPERHIAGLLEADDLERIHELAS